MNTALTLDVLVALRVVAAMLLREQNYHGSIYAALVASSLWWIRWSSGTDARIKKETFRRGREGFLFVSGPQLEPGPKTVRGTGRLAAFQPPASSHGPATSSTLLLGLGRRLLAAAGRLAGGTAALLGSALLSHGAYLLSRRTNLRVRQKAVNVFFRL
ncbi:MAG TPA: hypothetical protein VFB66_17780 [Tepidisphaeraceae bacterium]|nr:hypothetical protein [Tepidisphaeraceae bacterium]